MITTVVAPSEPASRRKAAIDGVNSVGIRCSRLGHELSLKESVSGCGQRHRVDPGVEASPDGFVFDRAN